MERHILSKSTFMRGLQCEKSLYLNKHRPDLRDEPSAELEAIFRTGHEVGELARGLFPGGIDASPPDPFHFPESVQLTKQLIDEGTDVIYEAALQHDQVLCAVDLLVRSGERWRAFEVKSATSVKDEYLWDVALQYYVVTGAGIELEDFALVYINNEYIRHGPLDPNQLFHQESLLGPARDLQPQVEEHILRFKTVLAGEEIPEIRIGPQCTDPYDCDFIGYCWREVPEDSVFDLRGLRKPQKFELYDQGIVRVEDVPSSLPLNASARLQVESQKLHQPVIHRSRIGRFLKSLRYPLYFLDFETINLAIPPFDNSRPYQQIPYQYSLHSRPTPNGEIRHSGFLAEPGSDPRKELAETLLGEVRNKGDVLVYNRSFEARVIRELAEFTPDLAPKLGMLESRLVDLMDPFRSQDYYMPEMKGSYSIKAVLPALVPEMGYEDLDVKDGTEAMRAFLQLADEEDPAHVEEIRNALWEYCKLDTYAMVCILEKLESLTGG